MVNTETLLEEFQRHFEHHAPHLIVRAPGRVNLIGEHTDYNDGYVLPIAMKQSLYVAARPREDMRMRARSRALDATAEWRIDEPIRPGQPQWADYCKGVTALLLESGLDLRGADLLIEGDLPLGSGLSSSAALEVGTAKALLGLGNQIMQATKLADLCRKAEHDFAGAPCGIMDQLICLLGHAGHALLLDCRTRQVDQIPFDIERVTVVVIDTQVKHKLGESEYAVRQGQCRKALSFFQGIDADIHALRDVSEELLAKHIGKMDPLPARRARHVVQESHRVLHAVEAIKAGAVHEFGQFMYESHRSLKDDYEVSCVELDAVVDIAAKVEGVYGARMTGGGFGGCVVALVEDHGLEPLRRALAEEYDTAFEKPALMMQTKASDGAELVRL